MQIAAAKWFHLTTQHPCQNFSEVAAEPLTLRSCRPWFHDHPELALDPHDGADADPGHGRSGLRAGALLEQAPCAAAEPRLPESGRPVARLAAAGWQIP